MPREHWAEVRDFVSQLLASLHVGDDHTHVALATFSDTVSIVLPLSGDESQVEEHVAAMSRAGGPSDVARGLWALRTRVFSGPGREMRSGEAATAAAAAVVVLGGPTSRNTSGVYGEAQVLLASG